MIGGTSSVAEAGPPGSAPAPSPATVGLSGASGPRIGRPPSPDLDALPRLVDGWIRVSALDRWAAEFDAISAGATFPAVEFIAWLRLNTPLPQPDRRRRKAASEPPAANG